MLVTTGVETLRSMRVSYPASIPLSTRTLNHLVDRIRTTASSRSRWRRLNPGRQALLVLAHLRNDATLNGAGRVRHRRPTAVASDAVPVEQERREVNRR
jgi:hypothetical protein